MSLSEASAGGDRLRSLCELRDRLALEIDNCSSLRDLAALSQRFVDVVNQIEAAGGDGQVGDPEEATFDELARRRAARGSNAPRAEPS